MRKGKKGVVILVTLENSPSSALKATLNAILSHDNGSLNPMRHFDCTYVDMKYGYAAL